MKTPIAIETGEFLYQMGISARKLALEAGVNPVILTRVLAGVRKDMTSSNADKLRAAMARLSPPPSTEPAHAPEA